MIESTTWLSPPRPRSVSFSLNPRRVGLAQKFRRAPEPSSQHGRTKLKPRFGFVHVLAMLLHKTKILLDIHACLAHRSYSAQLLVHEVKSGAVERVRRGIYRIK
jgi:hypothetical protein